MLYAAKIQNDLKALSFGLTNWFLLIMWTISIPANVLLADSNPLNPNPGWIRFFMNRWSCSTILFKYFHCRILIFDLVANALLLYTRIALEFELDLSMLINSGLPLFSIALIRKLWALIRWRLLVSRKSIVLPSFSTARYKYRHWPFTLIYVSSMRHLLSKVSCAFWIPFQSVARIWTPNVEVLYDRPSLL